MDHGYILNERKYSWGLSMRITVLLAVCTAVCCTATINSALSQLQGGAAAPFTLEITTRIEGTHYGHWDFANATGTMVTSDPMVEVAIRKVNTSGGPIIRRPQHDGWYGYTCEVRDEDGNLLPPKPPNQPNGAIGIEGHTRRGAPEMQPREADIVAMNIGMYFDLSKPGTYTIQVFQHVSNDPNSRVVQSNAIKVEVLAPK